MISGSRELRVIYPDLDENQYQPAGIDLTLGKAAELKHNDGTVYGILKDAKILPDHIEMQPQSMQVGGMMKDVFVFEPLTSYVVTTDEQIKIDKYSGQFYLPRSSCLRGGVAIHTAFGDPGFNGHLSFLLINYTNKPFVIEKGARFAQLINMEVVMVENEYQGDYNE